MFLMLLAGAMTSLVVYFKGLGLTTMLIALLASMLAFYMIGCAIKMVLDSFYEKRDNKVADEGEVIEKEASEPIRVDDTEDSLES